MKPPALIASLERFAHILPTLVRDVTDEDARWKPDDGAWSILEIVCHLADEEVEDFRTRLELTLRDPTIDWPPIDPEGWAIQRNYNQADLAETLNRFLKERDNSIIWLKSLDAPDWSSARVHPRFGAIHAGELLAAWAAHDTLHLRQIAKRHYQLTCRDADPWSPEYAGPWTA